jgi:hypothetical protein
MRRDRERLIKLLNLFECVAAQAPDDVGGAACAFAATLTGAGAWARASTTAETQTEPEEPLRIQREADLGVQCAVHPTAKILDGQ